MWDFEVINDGVALKASVLIEMAMNTSDYHTAEHYIVSLMFGAVDHKDLSLIHKCLEICEHHGVSHFREYKNLVMSYRFISEDKLRVLYERMPESDQMALLRKAMSQLLAATDGSGNRLFQLKQHWFSVYLVLRDRLNVHRTLREFPEFARLITPDDCPDELRIGKNTMFNMPKVITENRVYYRMKNNPQSELCDRFWNIVSDLILTTL